MHLSFRSKRQGMYLQKVFLSWGCVTNVRAVTLRHSWKQTRSAVSHASCLSQKTDEVSDGSLQAFGFTPYLYYCRSYCRSWSCKSH